MSQICRLCAFAKKTRFTLKVRRKRLDLIQLFKIINEFEDVDIGTGMGNNMMGVGGEDMGSKYLRKGRVIIP